MKLAKVKMYAYTMLNDGAIYGLFWGSQDEFYAETFKVVIPRETGVLTVAGNNGEDRECHLRCSSIEQMEAGNLFVYVDVGIFGDADGTPIMVIIGDDCYKISLDGKLDKIYSAMSAVDFLLASVKKAV